MQGSFSSEQINRVSSNLSLDVGSPGSSLFVRQSSNLLKGADNVYVCAQEDVTS
jgi:hypothetical protein